MRASIVAVGLTGAAFALAALVVTGPSTALSVAIGAAVATANLWALARIIAALLPRTEGGAKAQSRAGWGVVAVLKVLGLVAVVWLLMRHGLVSPLPLVVGFVSLPIGIAIGSLVSDRSARQED
ncbi:MAG TPA: ATP synthase subunit I [Polyangiaceae bacterium]